MGGTTSAPSRFTLYFPSMCGRVVQASDPLRYAFVDGLSVPDSRAKPPSYNVAPSQLLYVIRENHETGERRLDLLRWGLIPHGCTDLDGGRKPINARAESVMSLPSFRTAYAKRRCIVPVDCFFEWRKVDRTPFAIAGLWENWRQPQRGEWIRTFTIITVPANELVAQIHDRIPLILPKSAYEPDPHDLLMPFPAESMAMWSISTRVNSPENDDASLLEPAA
jgi:putative SOS response-associated peptidase YedK